jgi:hypothetical protein
MPDPQALDAITELAALSDPGPAVLGFPDHLDPNPFRDPGPREDDGPQELPQTPAPLDPAGEATAGDAVHAALPPVSLAEQAAEEQHRLSAADRRRAATAPDLRAAAWRLAGTGATKRPGRFVKRPVTIEAMRWDGSNAAELATWIGSDAVQILPGDQSLQIPTLEGPMRAPAGWWIVRGIAGELYPCRDDVFQLSYDPAPSLAGER